MTSRRCPRCYRKKSSGRHGDVSAGKELVRVMQSFLWASALPGAVDQMALQSESHIKAKG